MTNYQKAGEIEIEVTETTWSTITLNVSKDDLVAHDCANLREFRDKVRTGEIDPFMFNPTWNEPYDSSLEDYDYGDAKAFLPDGIELED
jgi:hypothetical protein